MTGATEVESLIHCAQWELPLHLFFEHVFFHLQISSPVSYVTPVLTDVANPTSDSPQLTVVPFSSSYSPYSLNFAISTPIKSPDLCILSDHNRDLVPPT